MSKKSFDDTIDALRRLSQPRPREQVERLKEIQMQTRMIGEIYGIYGGGGGGQSLKLTPKPAPQELTFEEKRRLLQAEYPNKVSMERRRKSREALNQMAKNRYLFTVESSSNSEEEESEKPKTGSNFSKMSYDAAYSSKTQSPSDSDGTVYNEPSTPVYHNEEDDSDVKTPVYSD
ncbi:hypothetical protein CRE_22970 [Caenorhabditis remanei]|uniref:Uncharacterized protein n=1 Tax=Caenorhabditis remanei TaxID=31234 RepID=E3MW39_CAERE|nr:hypothetical protein CRE_22970 [Caenorhabditis remanei]